MFNFDVTRESDMIVAASQEALKKAIRDEQLLLLECEKMRDENDKLKKLHSANVTFHGDIMEKLDNNLQAMTSACNELQQQLRVMNFQKNLDKEEFEKRLQIANQRTVVIQQDEEDNSFSHRLRHNLPNRSGDNGNTRNGHHVTNSTTLPAHGNARSTMSKVSHRVSEIMTLPHEDVEEAIQGSEIPETPEEEKFLMTRSKFKDIMTTALEDQSAKAIKVVFTKGVKHGSEIQNPMETETVR